MADAYAYASTYGEADAYADAAGIEQVVRSEFDDASGSIVNGSNGDIYATAEAWAYASTGSAYASAAAGGVVQDVQTNQAGDARADVTNDGFIGAYAYAYANASSSSASADAYAVGLDQYAAANNVGDATASATNTSTLTLVAEATAIAYGSNSASASATATGLLQGASYHLWRCVLVDHE